jgi:hypothetical protein
MHFIPQPNFPIPPAYDDIENSSICLMDYSNFNTEIAARPGPRPELGDPLTEEELEELWFSYVLEFGHLLDIPVRAISSRT